MDRTWEGTARCPYRFLTVQLRDSGVKMKLNERLTALASHAAPVVGAVGPFHCREQLLLERPHVGDDGADVVGRQVVGFHEDFVVLLESFLDRLDAFGIGE